jgi:hypothetical protein
MFCFVVVIRGRTLKLAATPSKSGLPCLHDLYSHAAQAIKKTGRTDWVTAT